MIEKLIILYEKLDAEELCVCECFIYNQMNT